MTNTIKTAISIQKNLFDQAESLAQELNMTRSHLIGMALEAYLINHQNKTLLEKINKSYSDTANPNEKMRLSKMRKQHRKLVENEW